MNRSGFAGAVQSLSGLGNLADMVSHIAGKMVEPKGPWANLTARDAVALFKRRALSPVELVKDILERIDEQNPTVNAFAYIDYQGALDRARDSEKRWLAGEPCGVLDGVPVTVKDLTIVAGMPVRYGSRSSDPLPHPDSDAPVPRFLRQAGANIIAKTTTSEFGWKAITDTPLHGFTRNPWNVELTPGGSSGGAGVASYLNLGLLHLGSDGGGSIRIPASFTGTFGLKPTFGLVPQWPTSLMGQLSHLGPLTRTVADAALMMSVIARADPNDGYIAHGAGIDWASNPSHPLRGLRICYSPSLFGVRVESSIASCVERAVQTLERMGAIVSEASPQMEDPVENFEALFLGGISQLADRLDEPRFALLDPDLQEQIEKGKRLTLSQYLRAERARERLIAQMQEFHQSYDLLVTPTLPIDPFEVGRIYPEGRGMSRWFDWAPFSYPCNLSQQPAASLPCGLSDAGLPVGLQLVGPRFGDAMVLSVAKALESALGQ